MIEDIKKRHLHEKENGSYINEQQCFDDREWLIKECDRLSEREFNHYPMEIEELESRIFKLTDDLEAAHDALEMLPPKDVEIHERTQFQIDKAVDRILLESLKNENKKYNELFQEIGIMCAFDQTTQILRILSVVQRALPQEGVK